MLNDGSCKGNAGIYAKELDVRYWRHLRRFRTKSKGTYQCCYDSCPTVYECKLHHMDGRRAAAEYYSEELSSNSSHKEIATVENKKPNTIHNFNETYDHSNNINKFDKQRDKNTSSSIVIADIPANIVTVERKFITVDQNLDAVQIIKVLDQITDKLDQETYVINEPVATDQKSDKILVDNKSYTIVQKSNNTNKVDHKADEKLDEKYKYIDQIDIKTDSNKNLGKENFKNTLLKEVIDLSTLIPADKQSKELKYNLNNLIALINNLTMNNNTEKQLDSIINTFISTAHLCRDEIETTKEDKRDIPKDLVNRIMRIDYIIKKYEHDLKYNRLVSKGVNCDYVTNIEDIVNSWLRISKFKNCNVNAIVDIVKYPIENDAEERKVKSKLRHVLYQSEKGNDDETKRYYKVCVDILIKMINYEKRVCDEMNKRKQIVHHCEIENTAGLREKVNIFVKEFLEKLVTIEENNLITDIIMTHLEKGKPVGPNYDIKVKIANILVYTNRVPVQHCVSIATDLVENANNIFKDDFKTKFCTKCEQGNQTKYTTTKSVSVYMSNECARPVTSTPKVSAEKTVYKLNKEEQQYMNGLSKLISDWMESLPDKFKSTEEKDFRNIIVTDLAGDVSDLFKLEQLAPGTVGDTNSLLKYMIIRWFHKFYDYDVSKLLTEMNDLVAQIERMPRPVLTNPQHGNRQAMQNLIYNQCGDKEDSFVPKAEDILEDEISIWMDNLPSELISVSKCCKGGSVHELAEKLKPKLNENASDEAIKNEIANWLDEIVNEDKKNELNELAEDLKNCIVQLPTDNTIACRALQRKADFNEIAEMEVEQSKTAIRVEDFDLDHTMKDFIVKFMDRNFEVDDILARGAFRYLLKQELLRLSAIEREQLNVCPAMTSQHRLLAPEKLLRQLDYIKIVSDWLKGQPVDPLFNTVGNKRRIDFVLDLAKTVQEVEDEQEANPEAMDFNTYIAPTILEYMENLPLTVMNTDPCICKGINNLIRKLVHHRKVVKEREQDETLDMSGINTNNIEDFIDEFVKINGNDIGDDEVKMEAWCVRLLREIKEMIRESAEPEKITKEQVCNRLENVPIPGNDSIATFNLELEYITQITEWMKNLPLLPITEEEKANRMVMISELAQVMTQRGTKYNDTQFKDYVTRWILKLPLEDNKEIVYCVVTQQLINRIEKVKLNNKSETFEIPCPGTCMKSSKKRPLSKEMIKDPSKWIMDSIKKWSSSLPVKADTLEEAAALKESINNTLYQKLGDYNLDPKLTNDDLLYEQIITDEVDTIMNSLPQSKELDEKRDKLKSEITHTLIEGRNLIKEKSAGDNYKHKLENTIETSLPKPPCARREYDPGFEIYKHRLADMFILENFDHTSDEVKEKYERMIKQEIDKYFENIKKKNRVRLSSDELRNELYSYLFKVPVPNEASTAEEVERVKTRCVIDRWFEELPLCEASGLEELLEWDNILATLAKRIHEIEKEPKSDNKVHKEIMKWLVKLPIVPEQSCNNEQFATNLQEQLKASTKQRTCLTKDAKSNKKSKGKGKSTSKVKVVGPNSSVTCWSEPDKPAKKPNELIQELVTAWTDKVPILTTTPELEKQAILMKGNLAATLIIKINEFSRDPTILNNDTLFDNMVENEVDTEFAKMPFRCDFDDEKREELKSELKGILECIKPMIRFEQERHIYKNKLNETVDTVLEKPEDLENAKEMEYITLKNEILDNFIQMNYDKDDEEARVEYRTKIDESIAKFLTNIMKIKDDKNKDLLIKRNQLICELKRVPLPAEKNIQKEIDEIRMKEEITQFFQDIGIKAKKDRPLDDIKANLAKKLADIEATGYNEESINKMNQEIQLVLRKLNKEQKPEIINKFIDKLRNTESVRKSKVTKLPECPSNKGTCGVCKTCSSSKAEKSSNNQMAAKPPCCQKQSKVIQEKSSIISNKDCQAKDAVSKPKSVSASDICGPCSKPVTPKSSALKVQSLNDLQAGKIQEQPKDQMANQNVSQKSSKELKKQSSKELKKQKKISPKPSKEVKKQKSLKEEKKELKKILEKVPSESKSLNSKKSKTSDKSKSSKKTKKSKSKSATDLDESKCPCDESATSLNKSKKSSNKSATSVKKSKSSSKKSEKSLKKSKSPSNKSATSLNKSKKPSKKSATGLSESECPCDESVTNLSNSSKTSLKSKSSLIEPKNASRQPIYLKKLEEKDKNLDATETSSKNDVNNSRSNVNKKKDRTKKDGKKKDTSKINLELTICECDKENKTSPVNKCPCDKSIQTNKHDDNIINKGNQTETEFKSCCCKNKKSKTKLDTNKRTKPCNVKTPKEDSSQGTADQTMNTSVECTIKTNTESCCCKNKTVNDQNTDINLTAANHRTEILKTIDRCISAGDKSKITVIHCPCSKPKHLEYANKKYSIELSTNRCKSYQKSLEESKMCCGVPISKSTPDLSDNNRPCHHHTTVFTSFPCNAKCNVNSEESSSDEESEDDDECLCKKFGKIPICMLQKLYRDNVMAYSRWFRMIVGRPHPRFFM